MSLLRQLKDDEGCDNECNYCGHHNLIGRCNNCGWEGRFCTSCHRRATTVNAMVHEKDEGIDLVFLCQDCESKAYEEQADDALDHLMKIQKPLEER